MTPERISYAEARSRVLAAVRPLAPVRVDLADLPGRALRESVPAPHALPPFANSAMDGFAVRAADTAAAPVVLPVSAVVPAGRVAPHALAPGTAMRIMTGAEIPAGADAIVPFEDAERLGEGAAERVRVRIAAAPGAHVRAAGADIAAGAIALEAGRALSPHDIALLAALGVTSVAASPRPRVAVISTGDELLPPDAPLEPGTIRDSNLPMLAALAREAGCEVVMAEHAGDDPSAVTAAIRRALAGADAVLTIGGVSAGDFDPVKESLDALGQVALWRVAMRPGRPQAFGAPGGRLFFGLPGNPASVACVFEALARPALRLLQGFATIDRPRLAARAAETLESKEGRVDFVRVTLAREDGIWWAAPAGAQVSGHLRPQSAAHALAIVPAEAARIARGEALEALLLRWPDDRAGA
jgi:molybdopterin molybdotransferase